MKNCDTKNCDNRVKGKVSICPTCKTRLWRKKNPMKAAYGALRDNARRRGKQFELTFEQFKQFCVKTSYMKKKGITRTCYHIDRIREEEGYTIGNIQLLTNIENLRKYRTQFHSEYDYNKKEMYFRTQTTKVEPIKPEEDPFSELYLQDGDRKIDSG